jgi:virulence-associated protein VagC
VATEIQTDETGTLRIPATFLPNPSPHTQYSVTRSGESVIIKPAARPRDFWLKLTPAERAQKFIEWVDSHKGGPGLSDWAVSRDSIYD